MQARRASASSTASTSIRKFMDGKITSKEYFQEVRESTSKGVVREMADRDKGTTRS